MAASNGSEYFEFDLETGNVESFHGPSNAESVKKDEEELVWEAISRLPSVRQGRFAILRRSPSEGGGENGVAAETIDVKRLDRTRRELVVKKALATDDQDNYKLLSAIKDRLDRVGLDVAKIEVRFQNINVEVDAQIASRALPTLINVARDFFENVARSLRILSPNKFKLNILKNVSGVVKPGRMTLLLGPPGSGKSTLLLALAGKLDNKTLKTSGDITYNGTKLDEFYVKRTSAYISQTDNHIPELTVRETLDFAARCQGASEGLAEYMNDLTHLEKERKIRPVPEIDAFMKASSVAGKHSISTDYVLKVLGLDVCSDTVVGNDMLRGVSGGQRKRVTTGEMIVGPRKTLFMDEISTGLDSSTTYQIVKCVRNFVHLMEGTVLMALLQPAPETFELFDDLVVLSEGNMVYQGPREEVLEFFESLGFKLPPRKGVADFLQEVTSKKDQAQYWADPSKPYVFIPVSEMANAFKNSRFGRSLESTLSVPYDKSQSHPSALSKTRYAASKWELLRTCFAREKLLISRHSFLYIFRTCQVAFVGFVTSTIFLRTRLHPVDEINGNLYISCLFFGLVHVMFNGFSELSLLIFRLPVFYKQRDNLFLPAWIWSVVSWILRVPYSIVESVVWSCVVYYTVGFAPAAGRFFRFMFLKFAIHQMAIGLFRMLAAIARDTVIANTFGSFALLIVLLLGGFLIPKDKIKPWWVWASWLSPLQYGQRAISANEFTATRWKKASAIGNNTVGYNILQSHGLPSAGYWYWLGVGVLLLYSVLFNIIVTLALAYLNPLRKGQAIFPADETEENSVVKNVESQELESGVPSANGGSKRKGMILPFLPLAMTFHNVNYYVDVPKEMIAQGIPERRLQLLSNVSGVFSPGVLTALVGSSGAGKTTLMDVLSGRKTGGYIEGDIMISGYPKEQKTFARISGYVEQNDIHSPQVTVEESLWFSSSLRLPKEISKTQRHEFVEEVMRLVELDTLRNVLVGLPGSSGLSTEQRKRLTIAVELVANPSIIFMDEPTSGLDARAAAIVMRTVRNTVDTGRTVVCTIHQPSIEIFESFDELLLMKRGGQLIYGGKLGVNSQMLIDYFQGISGIPSIPDGHNPATWMLEVTSPAVEQRIGRDFGDIYRNSAQYRHTTEGLFMVMGALYASCLFLGVNNASSVQPIVSIERTVFYRERAAGMYAPTPYAAAQGLVEVPYIAVQAILFGAITYFMINFERTARKFFLYLVFMFLTFTYYTFYGLMAVGLTPTQQMAAVVSSAFYSLWNLLSGFLIPKPRIPGWWIWFYYICPVAWTLKGIISSQLGDVETMIVEPTFQGTVKEYINTVFGIDPGMMGVSAAVLIGFCLFFFSIFAFSLKFLNFQKR
ncbi:ABC transporter G family member 31 isoform X2 [Durio zibethinus]|uniref:ABC transporter G family member 31 isoform X2 n=1 Tax=Durio zibethinus TaxID=66656 RepID=A0A6P5ZJG0_DURZI|nr:ABC transporter G family member 31 isoform X2 [Durio zibethinus]